MKLLKYILITKITVINKYTPSPVEWVCAGAGVSVTGAADVVNFQLKVESIDHVQHCELQTANESFVENLA